MKKVLPYIFMLLIITSFLAPFGVGMGKNVAYAACPTDNNPDGCNASLYKTFTQDEKNIYDKLSANDKKAANKSILESVGEGISTTDIFKNLGFTAGGYQATNSGSMTASQQATYNTLTSAQQLIYQSTLASGKSTDDSLAAATAAPKTNVQPNSQGYFQSLGCGLLPATWPNCLITVILYPVFQVTSFLFELSGKFFDWAFGYSVQDTSYRSPFVVQGWGIVRDFVDMFFIFVLLWVAISTILGIHGFNTKSMIINVIIIGLVINFSLLVPQIMTDTSNILARVFYNSNSISIKDSNGNPVTSLSAAIVNKVQPQNLIINPGKITRTDPVTGKTTTSDSGNLDATSAFLILILIIAVNVVGIIVFLSTGLMFVSRTIGLWLACVFVPFAFFSYTVPAMEGIELVGWKHWWPDTLKQAFLAPVFIFFLYLILRFLSTIDIFKTSLTTTGTDFILGIIVPFVFIMMLMWKAKDIAKSMSGTMGQAITGALSQVGGLALGAATGGAGLLGRGVIGRVANNISSGDKLNNAAAGLDAEGKPLKGISGRLLQFGAGVAKSSSSKVAQSSFDLRQTGAGNALSKALGVDLNRGLGAVGLGTATGLGGFAGARERKKAEEEKFGKSLGYDHHQYEHQEDTIRTAEDALNKHKTDVDADHGSNTYKAETARLQQELKKEEKRLEIIKSGREKEYALTVRQKSGNLYKNVVRDYDKDENGQFIIDPVTGQKKGTGYIKRFGSADDTSDKAVRSRGKEIWIDFAKGLAKGAAAGAVAGSIVPVLGTGLGTLAGAVAGAVKQSLERDRGALAQAGAASHDHKEAKDNYKPEKPDSPAPAHGGGDNHGGGGGGDSHGKH